MSDGVLMLWRWVLVFGSRVYTRTRGLCKNNSKQEPKRRLLENGAY